MTFTADEISAASGAPAEGYEFVGSATTWRYTSGVAAVTIDGNSYTPLAGLRRSLVSIGTTRDTPSLTVMLPITATVVQHYVFATPPRSLSLTVYRYQANSGTFEPYWQGEVTGITPKGEIAEAVVPSMLAARLSTNVPGLTIKRQCQHFLYDARCRVARASFDLATTISTVSDRTIVVAGVGGNPDQYYRAGEIVRDSDGERRSIISQIGTTLLISSAFRTLAATNAVTLYAGCDHTVATCVDKFSNLANFSGHPTVPKFNPWRVPLRLGREPS